MTIWEATTGALLSTTFQPSFPTAVGVSADGTAAFIGTKLGVFRIYDVTDRTRPRLIQQIRFYDESLPITNLKVSFCGQYILICNNKSDKVYVLSADGKKNFKVYGHYQFTGFVESASFTLHNGLTSIVVLLSNNLIAAATLPIKSSENRRQPIIEEDSMVFYRKVDTGSKMMMCNYVNQELFVVGDDKIMKKYEYPNEKFSQIDMKKAPPPPLQELTSHSLGVQCWATTKEFKMFVTGGKDGVIQLRNMSNFEKVNEIKAHTLFTGGVTAIAFSNTRSTLYTAGGDGSLMAWTIGGKPNPSTPVLLDNVHGRELVEMPEIERVPYD
jgi:WD40 repeat protein